MNEDQLGDGFERFEYADPSRGDAFEFGKSPDVDQLPHLIDACHVRQVPLVVLDDHGNTEDVVALLVEVFLEVFHALDVRLHPVDLGVGNENDAVDALENELPARVVEDLPRHGVEVESRLESSDFTEAQGKEVEEERPFGFRREGDHPSLGVGVGVGVDELQVGCFSAQTGPVVDDLAIDFSTGNVDK